MSEFNGKKYSVVLCDGQTGERRVCGQGDILWDDSSPFWWTDGNMGCDCNRELEFSRGKPVDDFSPCGDTRYTIESIIFNPNTPDEFHIRPERLGLGPPNHLLATISAQAATIELLRAECRAERDRYTDELEVHTGNCLSDPHWQAQGKSCGSRSCRLAKARAAVDSAHALEGK